MFFFWIPRPRIQKTTFSDIGSPSHGQIRHIKQDFVSGLPGNCHPFFDGRAVCSWSKRAGRCCCGPLPIPSYLPCSLAPSVQDVQRSASGSEKMASERTWNWFDLICMVLPYENILGIHWWLVFIGDSKCPIAIGQLAKFRGRSAHFLVKPRVFFGGFKMFWRAMMEKVHPIVS